MIDIIAHLENIFIPAYTLACKKFNIIISDKQMKHYISPLQSTKLSDHFRFNGILMIVSQLNQNGESKMNDFYNVMIDNMETNNLNLTLVSHGYVNILLNDTFIQKMMNECSFNCNDNMLNGPKHHVLIDYCSPNIAKQLHVGHLRSAIIGENIARIHKYHGNEVYRISHITYWRLGHKFWQNYGIHRIKKYKS